MTTSPTVSLVIFFSIVECFLHNHSLNDFHSHLFHNNTLNRGKEDIKFSHYSHKGIIYLTEKNVADTLSNAILENQP